MEAQATGAAAGIQKLMGNRCSCVWPPPELPAEAAAADSAPKRKKKKAKSKQKVVGALPPITDLTPEQRSAIRGRVFVSNADAARDRDLLEALGVTVVISVGGGRGAEGTVADFLHFVIRDHSEEEYLPVLREAADFAGPALTAGRSVLVHCRGGMHRSPTVAAALLIRHAGQSGAQARRCVLSGRPSADFARHLVEQLDLFETECEALEDSAM